MAEKITDVIPSETWYNDTSIAMESVTISSDLEGNYKTRNKNKEKPLPDELASFTSIIVSAIDNIRNIKCKRPDIDAIYRYISKNVATNVERNFIETIIVELVKKYIIFNKPIAQGLDSYFIVNAKDNSEVTDSNIGNGNVDSSSNISSDINKTSSNENTKIIDNINPPLLHNIDTPLLVKHGQSNTELQALKNYILKIEAQMSALKSHVKGELSTLANKTETMSLNLWKTVNAQQESVNKNVELLQQNTSYLEKELTSKNETIKSLLEAQSALIESLNKPTVNEFRIPNGASTTSANANF